jgi:hypothetical protein
MQIQNPFSNFSGETKQNDPDNNNNPINFINFQNSPKEINSSINKNNQAKKEKENIENKNKFELKDINHININENLNNSHFPKKSPKNNSKSIFDFPITEEKMDTLNNIDCKYSPFSQNFEKNENNNIDNTNDENFFNYSFYNNNKKNINKIINNNNNKIIENKNNNEINYNSKNEKENIFQNDIVSKDSPHIDSPKRNEHINYPNNFVDHEFSYENSNSNFRKKARHKKHFKVRFGDWICPKCENLNFSFRSKCNRCGLSKEKSEQNNNNNNQIQPHENNLDYQRPILFNNININYIFNSNYPLNNINIIYSPIFYNNNNINNYYGNYNNYQIYYPCNVNIK